jgi:uncharacterized lipoprotein
MKISKTLIKTIMVAVSVGTISACTKSVEPKATKQNEVKSPKTEQVPEGCPACGMG